MAEYIIGAIFGFKLGLDSRSDWKSFSDWEPFIEKYEERRMVLVHQKVSIPVGFFRSTPNGAEIFAEAIYGHLFGLPNSSIPMSIKCFELALKKKHSEIEGSDSEKYLYSLINWAENFLGNKRELAHGFRLLRNLLHEDKVIEEADALEGLRHIAILLNLLYPFEKALMSVTCPSCSHQGEISLTFDECVFGNYKQCICSECKKTFNQEMRL